MELLVDADEMRAEIASLRVKNHQLHVALRDAQALVARGETIDSLRKENARLEARDERYSKKFTTLSANISNLEAENYSLHQLLAKAPRPSKTYKDLQVRNKELQRENAHLRWRLAQLTAKVDHMHVTRRTAHRMRATLAIIETAATAAAQAKRMEL